MDLPATITVTIWHDPVVDPIGYPAASGYVEAFWLPIIGPSATWALRRLTGMATACPDGARLPLTELALSLGLGAGTGRNAPIVRTISRLVTFGLARLNPDGTLAVRARVAPLTNRHLLRLPPTLRAAHDKAIATRAAAAPAPQPA